jgi:hypothetical protein
LLFLFISLAIIFAAFPRFAFSPDYFDCRYFASLAAIFACFHADSIRHAAGCRFRHFRRATLLTLVRHFADAIMMPLLPLPLSCRRYFAAIRRFIIADA